MHFETIETLRRGYPNYVKVVLAEVPESAPQEVKEIVNKYSETFGAGCPADPAITFRDERFNKSLYAQRIFRLGEELQSRGYNPSDYGINMERLNNELQLKNAEIQHQQLTKEINDLQYRQKGLSFIERKLFNPYKQKIQELTTKLAEISKAIAINPITQMKKQGLTHFIQK